MKKNKPSLAVRCPTLPAPLFRLRPSLFFAAFPGSTGNKQAWSQRNHRSMGFRTTVATITWYLTYPLRLLWQLLCALIDYAIAITAVCYLFVWGKVKEFLRPILEPCSYITRQLGRFTLQVIKYSILLICYVSSALFFAIVIYGILYYNLVPYIAIQKPLYFNFRSVLFILITTAF